VIDSVCDKDAVAARGVSSADAGLLHVAEFRAAMIAFVSQPVSFYQTYLYFFKKEYSFFSKW